jgi:diaminopimelate decarboxylase
MELTSGTYRIQGIDVKEIADQFGTPLYVYDGNKIAQQIKTLKNAFAGTSVKVKYAAKALTNISILKLIRREGAGVDVVSPQEALLALRAGFTPSEIMFTPSGVEFEEIEEGVKSGFSINLDNLSVLEKFGKKYGNSYPCCVRLNPHILAGGNIKISTGHINSKFGISIEQLSLIKEIVEKYNIVINGLHIHTGSDITDADVFLKIGEVLFDASKYFPHLTFIDFGSGFKVAYKEGDKVMDINDLGKKMADTFNKFCDSYGRKLELWIEPGKFLVSEAGTLLVKVNVVKQSPTVTFVGVNSGLNHLIRPMMYDAYHHIVNVSNPTGELKTYNVVGYICETDTFATARPLNEVKEGDLLALKNAGAYGFSMASNYNSRLRPAEVLVIDGKAKLIRERETFDDLVKGQIAIEL